MGQRVPAAAGDAVGSERADSTASREPERIARREADTAGTAVGDDECGHDTLRVRGGNCRNENYPARKSAINLVFLTCLCGSFTSACQPGAELADRDGSA